MHTITVKNITCKCAACSSAIAALETHGAYEYGERYYDDREMFYGDEYDFDDEPNYEQEFEDYYQVSDEFFGTEYYLSMDDPQYTEMDDFLLSHTTAHSRALRFHEKEMTKNRKPQAFKKPRNKKDWLMSVAGHKQHTKGWDARLLNVPYLENRPEEWQMGWMSCNRNIQEQEMMKLIKRRSWRDPQLPVTRRKNRKVDQRQF